MIETITLDTRKCYSPVVKPRISPLRRGERNNVTLTVAVRRDRRPYDLTGMTAHLVWKAEDDKLVGPVPMEVTDQAAGNVRCTLPDACYSAVGTARAYIELRMGAELVDTTDEMSIEVLDCIDADAEQAEEYKPLIAEVREATDAAKSAAERAESGEDERAATERARVSAEESRKQAEQARKQAESTRASSETLRALSETSRAEAESMRKQAESLRGESETKREEAFAKSVEKANAANDAAAKAATDAQAAIADVKATEAKLYPAAENILVGSETGTVAHVDDAFDGSTLRKITVEGACKQDGIPSPDAPKPIAVVENPVVKVVGRNVLDIAALAKESPEYYKADGDTLTILKTDNRDWKTFAATQELKAGTYILSGDFVEIKDIDGNNLSFSLDKPGAPFKIPVDTKVKVKVGYGRASESYPYTTKAMIERSSSASDYAPYSTQSRAFALPAEHPYLAKLPDGTADEIVVDAEGNVELVARVGVDKNVRDVEDFAQGQYYSLRTTITSFKSDYDKYNAPVMCSALPFKNTSSNNEGIYRTWNGIYVRDTSGRTKEQIQTEVDKNAPLTVVAVIPETRYSLGKIEMPKAQDSIVNVWTDAEVTSNTGIEYTRDVNIVIANLESAIASITQG